MPAAWISTWSILPYIDRIWIGEGRDYNTPPDYWLVEISGIPFGVMGEMLENGGNPWRGMIYGMTGRLPYMADPRPIWKLWDEIPHAGKPDDRLLGARLPGPQRSTFRVGYPSTVSSRKTLLSIASWAAEKVDCRLTIDFAKMGLDPRQARLRAPAVSDLQPSATFRPNDLIARRPRPRLAADLGGRQFSMWYIEKLCDNE